MSKHPEVLWAQRSSATASEKNIIYLTVNLPDIIPETLQYELTSTSLSFKARGASSETDYEFKVDLFAEVDTENSQSSLSSRSFTAVLRKKEAQAEYWPRLTKDKLKSPFIKTDFSKWVDEDEQDGNPVIDDDFGGGGGGFPGMGMGMDNDMLSQLGNLGAGAGAGAGEGLPLDADSDSDEDGPPPLEDGEPSK